MKSLKLFVFLSCVCLVLVKTSTQAQTSPTYHVEPVVSQAQFPVAMAFTPDGRLFYTEKETGRVRVVNSDGHLQPDPVISLETDSFVERGMLGIAVDPDYEDNGYIWVYHTQPNIVKPPYPINQIVRFSEEDGVGSEPVVMLEIPVITRVGHHNGGNLHFDADGLLYVSVGDYGEASFAQDLSVIPGKIHRFALEDDQLVPAPDNPFPDSSVFAYGLRNPFDFDFDPLSSDLIAGENGPTCDDEINVIFAGGNYGWRPDYPCDDKAPSNASYVYPLVYYTPPEAITGVLVYDGEMFADWYGDVFYCGWNFGKMRRMTLNKTRDLAASIEEVDLQNHSCSTDVEVAPDGSIYFTSADAIYRIVAD